MRLTNGHRPRTRHGRNRHAIPGDAAAIAARDLVVGYGGARVLDGLDLVVERGTTTALVGPNGSGKSTLLRTLVRLLRPEAGAVLLDGAAIQRLPTREVARRLAVLPQQPEVPAGITVRELTEQGRYPHVGALRTLGAADRDAVDRALEATGMQTFAHRRVDELSGGERQKAWIALALAQDTPMLLLDEPTTFLDLGHQFEVLELVGRLRDETGLTVVLVLHDLNQAARHAARLVVLDRGAVVADGTPARVLTRELLRDIFRVHAEVTVDTDGVPVAHPKSWAGPRQDPQTQESNARVPDAPT